jgi:DNA helicase INO80
MVISGGQFKPDALKPKEVVSLLLDDAEMECKFIQKQAEKKADDQKKRRERKRKQTDVPAQVILSQSSQLYHSIKDTVVQLIVFL